MKANEENEKEQKKKGNVQIMEMQAIFHFHKWVQKGKIVDRDGSP